MKVIENVFKHYDEVVKTVRSMEYKDIVGPDGVIYPNIVEPLDFLRPELEAKGIVDAELLFGRYTFEDTNPPNWAHCDADLAPFVGLMPLGFEDEVKTFYVAHKTEHMYDRLSPSEAREITMSEVNDRFISLKQCLDDANSHDRWNITFTNDYVINCLYLIPTSQWHAASKGFGTTRGDGRLMLTMFCDFMI